LKKVAMTGPAKARLQIHKCPARKVTVRNVVGHTKLAPEIEDHKTLQCRNIAGTTTLPGGTLQDKVTTCKKVVREEHCGNYNIRPWACEIPTRQLQARPAKNC
jgi:hypothetical protein